MYLKSIEIQGFKSFAHKIVFDFHNGITGIVGPNGSGKSNVADAVRWVLGEQRVKQLRGGSMQDVIFSGTENRRPLSFAMVSITLDNKDHQLAIDFEEVTVTRKLYRSGESEYLLNGSVCRLKDVNELFYDTGIGKEGYSIIGQGQIDKILSGKPEERRELFDEAAGIVKFKRRKNISVKKLEEEQQNLLRVNDILEELEKQKRPLERQAGVAKEYLKKKEELRVFDINMFLVESARLQEQIQEAKEKLELTKQELEDSTSEYHELKKTNESVEDQVEALEESIEKSKRQLNETTLLKQQLEGQIQLLNEQIHSVKSNDEHFGNRLRTIEAELRSREAQKTSLLEEKEKIQKQLDAQEEHENAAKDELFKVQTKIATISSDIDSAQNDIIELLNNRASTKAKIQRYDTMLEQIQARKLEVEKRLVEVNADVDKQVELLETYNGQLKEVSEQIILKVERSKEIEAKIASIQEKLNSENELLSSGLTAYHRETSRLESLKNMAERYEGYGNSIRKIMEQKEKNTGIMGVVADLFKVDQTYEIAIETALGGSIQNIVTDTPQTAKQMITYLKQNRFGRATFLPLSTVKGSGSFQYPQALNEPGVIGLASTLVKVEEKYKGLIAHLLGRTIVVEKIDDGIALSGKYRQSLRIVTKEGELINPGGSMTGGAFKNSSNLLSRKREIEEFEKSIALLKTDIAQKEKDVEALKANRTNLYAELDLVKEELQQAYVVQNTAKMNANQATAKKDASKGVASSLSAETEELDNQMTEIEENKNSINLELETSQQLERELSTQIETQQKQLEEEKTEESKRLKNSEESHISFAGLEQQNLYIIENLNRITQESEKFQQELDEINESKGEASEEIQTKEAEIEDIRQTIENSKELFDEIEAEIERFTKEREELNQQHKAFIEKREELSSHMSDLDKECYRLESRLETSEENKQKKIDYMWEEYEITYNHAMTLRDENLTDLAYMKKQIQTLKSDIKGLGDVNVNAIEDFKQLSERYEFLKGQHDDLIEAEATLMKIIDELDEAMRKQFTEQFALISAEFDQVFKELFGGGKGTLELLDDADVLEAGIRITAQPPGKKLQNMMQLSGGEKALTAISLLFAIQNLKPSPFCLLDEIEAALDDSNVTRFAQYLHKLTENTQFIVITHRRGTMTAADRLYGITMQEKGISTMVSVDLLENDLEKDMAK